MKILCFVIAIAMSVLMVSCSKEEKGSRNVVNEDLQGSVELVDPTFTIENGIVHIPSDEEFANLVNFVQYENGEILNFESLNDFYLSIKNDSI